MPDHVGAFIRRYNAAHPPKKPVIFDGVTINPDTIVQIDPDQTAAEFFAEFNAYLAAAEQADEADDEDE